METANFVFEFNKKTWEHGKYVFCYDIILYYILTPSLGF